MRPRWRSPPPLRSRRTPAIEIMNRAHALARQIGDALGEAAVLTDLGAAFEKLKHFESARASYLEAYEAQKRLGNRAAQLPILLSLAGLEPDYDHAMARC